MGKFRKRRYFIQKAGFPPMTFAPVIGVLCDNIADHPGLQEVGFRKWFEEMWQHSDFTDAPHDVPNERDYWEHWV